MSNITWKDPMKVEFKTRTVPMALGDVNSPDRNLRIAELEFRDVLATFTYRGHRFYLVDWSDPRSYNRPKGIVCAQTGLTFYATPAVRLEDVSAILRSQLDLKWKVYLERKAYYAPRYNQLINGVLWLM